MRFGKVATTSKDGSTSFSQKRSPKIYILKESDTTNGEGFFRPFVLSDSLNRISPDSAAVASMSKDGPFWIDVLRHLLKYVNSIGQTLDRLQ